MIKRLIGFVEDEPNKELCHAHNVRIKELQVEVNALSKAIREAETKNAAPPAPLGSDRVKQYVGDLRAVLNQEIPAAAEAIRNLTGPIHIRQEAVHGRKRGARWIASFTPDLVRLLRKMSRDKHYPESVTLEYLSARNWIRPSPVEIAIDDATNGRSEEIVRRIDCLQQSVRRVAKDIGLSPATVAHIYDRTRLLTGHPNGPTRRTREQEQLTRQRIAEMLRSGHEIDAIMRETECSYTTVLRVRRGRR